MQDNFERQVPISKYMEALQVINEKSFAAGVRTGLFLAYKEVYGEEARRIMEQRKAEIQELYFCDDELKTDYTDGLG